MNLIDRIAEIAAVRDSDALDAQICALARDLLQARAARIERSDPLMLSAFGSGDPESAGGRLESASDSLRVRRVDDGFLMLVTLKLGSDIVGWLEILLDQDPGDQAISHARGLVKLHGQLNGLIDYGGRDHLTGLPNRSRLATTFAKMLERARHESASGAPPVDPPNVQSLWIAVADIDHFKRVNDRFGHVFGDELLVLVSRLLRAQLRPVDQVFRTGGEEFTILLSHTDGRSAHSILERLRCHVMVQRLPQGGNVTISIGYARVLAVDTPVSAFERADAALYSAKRNGRNGVVPFDDIAPAHQAAQMNVEAELF